MENWAASNGPKAHKSGGSDTGGGAPQASSQSIQLQDSVVFYVD